MADVAINSFILVSLLVVQVVSSPFTLGEGDTTFDDDAMGWKLLRSWGKMYEWVFLHVGIQVSDLKSMYRRALAWKANFPVLYWWPPPFDLPHSYARGEYQPSTLSFTDYRWTNWNPFVFDLLWMFRLRMWARSFLDTNRKPQRTPRNKSEESTPPNVALTKELLSLVKFPKYCLNYTISSRDD